MDNKLLKDLAEMSDLAYEVPNVGSNFYKIIPQGYTLIGERTSIPLGSNAASFYNHSTNTLVIGSAGTIKKPQVALLAIWGFLIIPMLITAV